MHRGTKNTVVLALTKWFLSGHLSKVERDGHRYFPNEEERNKNRKRITLAVNKLPDVGMRKSLQEWLRRLDVQGRLDWFHAVMATVPEDELEGELIRLAQMSPWRREATLHSYHSTPWMAAFHRLRGRGHSGGNQAIRWVVAAGIVGLLLWILARPYVWFKDVLRFFMERGGMEAETINLWVPHVMQLLWLIAVVFVLYRIFRKSPEEREVKVKATESDDDTASETTVVKKKEEKKTTTKSSTGWSFVGRAAVIAVAALVVIWAFFQMNDGMASTNDNSRATCQFGTDHLPKGVGCVVNITLPKDETPECTRNCSEADKNRYLSGRCSECRSTIAVQVGSDGWPTAVRAYTRGTEGSEFNKDMCARANEGWMSHARWESTGSPYFFYLRRPC